MAGFPFHPVGDEVCPLFCRFSGRFDLDRSFDGVVPVAVIVPGGQFSEPECQPLDHWMPSRPALFPVLLAFMPSAS